MIFQTKSYIMLLLKNLYMCFAFEKHKSLKKQKKKNLVAKPHTHPHICE